MKEKKAPISQHNLLIVDDDTLFGDSLKAALESDILSVTFVSRVSLAQELCFENSYDVVLLDNNLPDGKGLELVPDILNTNDCAKIILITAFPTFDNAVSALKNGAYDYISKPIDFDELQATIERALRASSLEAVEQVARYQSDLERRDAALVGFSGFGKQHPKSDRTRGDRERFGFDYGRNRNGKKRHRQSESLSGAEQNQPVYQHKLCGFARNSDRIGTFRRGKRRVHGRESDA